MFLENLRVHYKITVAVLVAAAGVFFDFIGLCVAQSATLPTSVNFWGLYWFFFFFYIFLLSALVWASGTDSLKSDRFLLLALTTIAIAYVPIDINQALNWTAGFGPAFSSNGIQTGAALKVAGLIIFIFPLFFILLLLGAEEESIVHKGAVAMEKSPAPGQNPYSSQQYGQQPQGIELGMRPQSDFINPIIASGNAEAVAANEARNSIKPASRLNVKADSVVMFKARSLYAYNANPSDPTEISFKKGEILNVIDSKGKWWHVQRVAADGTLTSGIAPSNYLQTV